MTATILQFPVRHKGRKRKVSSPWAEGMLSLYQAQEYPDNVVYYEQQKINNEVCRRDIVDFITITLFEHSSEARETVRRAAGVKSAFSKNAEERRIAVDVLRILGMSESPPPSISKIPFDPTNPNHQQAWASLVDLGLSDREGK